MNAVLRILLRGLSGSARDMLNFAVGLPKLGFWGIVLAIALLALVGARRHAHTTKRARWEVRRGSAFRVRST